MSADGNTPGRWILSVQFRAIGKAYGRGLRKCGPYMLRVIGPQHLVDKFVADPTVPKVRRECEGHELTCEKFRCRSFLPSTPPFEMPGKRIAAGTMSAKPFLVDLNVPHRCVLRLADEHPHGMTSDEVAKILGCSRRRVEQVVSLAEARGDLEIGRDPELADLVPTGRIVSLPGPERENITGVITPANASIHMTVTIGERVAELTLTTDASRVLLAMMRNAQAQSLRDARRAIRAALEAP